MASTPEQMRERRNKRRQIINEVLGNKCKECGSTEDLEVDHIDPNIRHPRTKSNTIYNGIRVYDLPYDEFLAELKLCQRLCFDCRVKKTSSEKLSPTEPDHGTMQRYTNKKYACRCGPCTNARHDHYVKFQKKRI